MLALTERLLGHINLLQAHSQTLEIEVKKDSIGQYLDSISALQSLSRQMDEFVFITPLITKINEQLRKGKLQLVKAYAAILANRDDPIDVGSLAAIQSAVNDALIVKEHARVRSKILIDSINIAATLRGEDQSQDANYMNIFEVYQKQTQTEKDLIEAIFETAVQMHGQVSVGSLSTLGNPFEMTIKDAQELIKQRIVTIDKDVRARCSAGDFVLALQLASQFTEIKRLLEWDPVALRALDKLYEGLLKFPDHLVDTVKARAKAAPVDLPSNATVCEFVVQVP